MAFFPLEQFVLRTHLSPDRVRQKLSDAIETRSFSWTGPSPDHKPFRGTLQENEFEIRRILHYRNSFLPIMKGEIRSEMGETVVNVTMMPHILTILFMTVWLGFSACIFLMILCTWISSVGTFEGSSALAVLMPAGMFALGYTLSVGAFKFEASKSKSSLQELLEAYQE